MTRNVLIIGGCVLWALMLLFVWSLCIAAKHGDDMTAAMHDDEEVEQ